MRDSPACFLNLVRALRIFICSGQAVICTVSRLRIPGAGIEIAVVIRQGRDILTANLFGNPEALQRIGI